MQCLSFHTGFKNPLRCAPSSPVFSKYGGAAAAPLTGEVLISFPVLRGTVSPFALYSHCYYGSESQILSSAIESDTIIVQLPMNLVLPFVTVKDLRHMVSMHNICLPLKHRSREQLCSQLLYHEQTCSCGSFVSVIKRLRTAVKHNDEDCGLATLVPSSPVFSVPSPMARAYNGGILAATPLSGETLIAFPVLLRNVSVADVYYHRLYRPEAGILLSTIEDGSLVMKIPMSMVIPSVTVKEMRRIVSLHNVRLPTSCRTREQVTAQLLTHEKFCSCSSFVSIIHPSKTVAVNEDEEFDPAMICSLDLAPHLVMGELQCGKYEFVAYDVPLPDVPADDIVYAACLTRDIARFVPNEVLHQVCHLHNIHVPLLANRSQLYGALRSHFCPSSCFVGISQFKRLPDPVRIQCDDPSPLLLFLALGRCKLLMIFARTFFLKISKSKVAQSAVSSAS